MSSKHLKNGPIGLHRGENTPEMRQNPVNWKYLRNDGKPSGNVLQQQVCVLERLVISIYGNGQHPAYPDSQTTKKCPRAEN